MPFMHPKVNGRDFIYYITGLIVLYAFGSVVYDRITGNDPESVARREHLVAEQAQQAAQAKIEFEREDARRTFALKESPVLWKTIEDLKARIVEQDGKLAKLKKTFDDLGMSAERDDDYNLLMKDRDEMMKQLQDVEVELDRAFLASVKYEVTRGKRERAEFNRSVRDDGLLEAFGTRQKFESLRNEK